MILYIRVYDRWIIKAILKIYVVVFYVYLLKQGVPPKKGKFGLYVTIDGKNISVKFDDKCDDEIVLDDVIPFIKKGKQSGSSLLKQLDENISIRKGKYGPYVFYKTDKMKKPRFINMKGKSIEDITISWVTKQL